MRKLLLFLCGLLLLTTGAFAQSQATTGNIEGRVVDQQGAAIPNVTVNAKSQDTGAEKNAQSNDEGNFVLPLLPPGSYTVTTAAGQGFGASTYENVRVTVGAKNSLEIVVSAGGSVNVVDVNAEGQGVETTRTSISSTVDERRVINLPTNGRNFLDFVTLTPGIVRDPTRSGDLAVGGQKGTLNSLQIDGTSSDNTFFGQSSGRIGSGRAPSQFSIDTVKEFQVNQNGFSAEFGRAAGAVINVVTKSGTNRFTGSAFEYFRDESLNARSPVLVAANRARPAGQINQFGGTFGGPIKKDRVFFFGAYEGQRSNLPNPVVVRSLPFAPAGVQTLLGPRIASYNINRQQDTFLAKVDVNINDRNQFWVRFNQQNFTGTNLENSGTLSAEEHTGNSNVKTSALSTSLTSTLSANWFNEFRFQYSRDRAPGLANTNDPEATVAANAGGINDGTFSFGRNSFSPRETTITRYQFVNNQTYIVGNHTVKYGFDFLFDRIFNFFPGLFGGSYTFANVSVTEVGATTATSLTAYQALDRRISSRYRQSFAGAGTTGGTTNPNSSEYGFFVQDDWRVIPKLTLNLGLRYDYQRIAKPLITNPNPALLAAGFNTGFRPNDRNNLAPRVGFAYSFDEKSVLRGGYGLFYARTPAILTGTAHSQNGIQVVAIDIVCRLNLNLANNCPTYPNVFTAPPTGAALAPINLYLFNRNYEQPFTQQARVQYEREVFANTNFSVQYTLFRGSDLTRTRNANLSAPVTTVVPIYSGATPTGETFTFVRSPAARPIPTFQRISLFESTAKSFYQGLSFELNRRFANRWQFNTSYTLSRAKDDKPDQTSVVPGGGDDAKIAENQFDLTGEYGRSDLDVRHRFIFSPVYETGTFKYSENKVVRAILSDYILTGIVTAQSGLAYSALVSGDPNGDGITSTDRVPGTRRNEFSTPSTFQVDLRVGRAIRFGERARLTLFAEGFNIFNRSNVQLVNNTQYSFSTAGTVGGVSLPARLSTSAANFGTPRQFVSGSPSFTFNSSYNREFQLGVRFDF
ncbi:MAG: TonB-dependent receptor [Pyrinomonadaceae bacterium]|nr:TonB-dependent receptor [Pyrinomonadaceae bacterium]